MRHVRGSPMPEKVTSLPEQVKGVLTEDAMLGGKIRLQQPKEGFRAAIDTVFLAAAVPAKAGQCVLEAGTGSGAAALCLAHRVEGVKITGIDVNPRMVLLADANIQLNREAETIRVAVGDVAGRLPEDFDAAFDHVMMNPPYLPDTSTHVSPNPDRALATVESGADLKRWLKYGHDALRSKGYLTVIHRADRLDEVIQSLSQIWPVLLYCRCGHAMGKKRNASSFRPAKGFAAPLEFYRAWSFMKQMAAIQRLRPRY
jgi:tRNA1(Val) A37 N6-methylase TrmN6